MCVPKRALLADYYPDELPRLLKSWLSLSGAPDEPKPMDAMRFFGGGGEVL